MIGKPKYKLGDKVMFKVGDLTKCGVIEVVDKWGTFMDKSDVSYDIMVDEENMLYKHFTESLMIKKLRK